jgi:peptidoglycan/xylan/chitin deacetylase (PgdA/CDA1 family)
VNRRTFIKSTAISSLAFGLSAFTKQPKTHILTLSFDDGFKKSFYKVAEIYEAHGLSACFNVIASGHLPGFQAVGEYILPELMGNFDDWNHLKSRGHEVMPHSWKHLNLTQQPVEDAKALIVKCLSYFEAHLTGYKSSEAVFNFPFNASTPELEAFTMSKVLAIRSYGESSVSALPKPQKRYRQACWSKGPENIDNWVEEMVNSFLESEGGWMILNTHGLDEEGWGPMSSSYLQGLLSKLVKVEKLEMIPTGVVLGRSRSKSVEHTGSSSD